MTWTIACFCGHLIDIPTCPHCGSQLPDLTVSPSTPPQADDRPSRLPRTELVR
jgi:hypothetical protein